MTKLDGFTTAYIEAALWSSTGEPFGMCEKCGAEDKVLYWNEETRNHELCYDCAGDGCQGSPYEPPLDENYDISDIAPEALAKIITDCEAFQAKWGELFTDEYNLHCGPDCDDAVERAGHDFWLTRNGHGAGFWDGGWDEQIGHILTEASKMVGECNLYVGDDGKLYI